MLQEFQWAKRVFATYMKAATYWQRMELVGFMLNFLPIVSAIVLCCCHRNLIYVVLMAMEEILYMYKTDATIFTAQPSEGCVSAGQVNDLKFIHQQDPHQISILSRVLDHIVYLKQGNRDGSTG